MSDEIRAKISASKMGHTVSVETREKLSVKNLGNQASFETRAKISSVLKGHPYWGLEHHPYYGPEHQSPETVEKRAASNRGKLRSDAIREKMSIAQKGHKVSPETRTKLVAANIGKHPSSETLAKMSESHSNQSEETRAKISAALTGHPKWGPEHQTAETRLKMSIAQKGRKASPETCAKLSAARIGFKFSPEALAKMSTSHIGQTAWNKGKPMSEASRVAIFSVEAQARSAAKRWKGGDKVSSAKSHAKRRVLSFIPLNHWFVGCEGHHVDDTQVIHIPKKLHKSIPHNQWTGYNMAKINAIAYNFLFKQEVKAAMAQASA